MLTCSTAFAAPTDQERAAARSLATEGINALENGRVGEAADKLERAYQLASIPTIGLWSARALEKLGKLVEANERLVSVGRYDMARTDPDVFNQAKADAEQMQAALAPRIPRLKVELVNAEGTDPTVELDRVPLKSALVGVPFQVNPDRERQHWCGRGGRRPVFTALRRQQLRERPSHGAALRWLGKRWRGGSLLESRR